MKHFLYAIVFLMSGTLFAQSGITFEGGTFKEVLAKAKTEKKLVFLDAYAAWCAPCKLMEKNIFTRPAVKSYYDANFINARFDMEKGEGRDIAAKYGIRSYPSFLFLNGDGEVVMKNYGYMEENDFLNIAKEANDPKLKTASYKELFDKGEKDPDFLLNMMRAYVDNDYDLAKTVSERYFQVKKNEPLTKDDLGLLLYFLKSPQDKNYTVFKAKKAEIEKLMSPEIYEQFDANIKISKILEKTLDQTTGIINDAYFYSEAVPLIGKVNADIALNRMKVLYYPTIGKFDLYEKAALEYYNNSDNFDPAELLKGAWIISQHSQNPVALKKAQEWAEKSVMKGETTDNTYILALLYSKTNNKESAKIYAGISKNLATAQGKDSSLAEQLLKDLK